MAARVSGVDDEVRALYHGPFGEFIAARDALAKRLKQTGNARAAEVKQLRKPSLSAWAVDQLFAHEPRAMAAFLGAGERARAAQRRAASGGDPKPLREALATIRGEAPRLTARGVELLAATEKAPGEAIVERLRTNLEALALDPEAAPVAARGWLDADLDPPGFEVMAALQVAASGGAVGKVTRTPSAAGPRSLPRGESPPATRGGKGGEAASGSAARGAAKKADRPLATVHRFDDARSAAAERRERADRDRLERERRARRERLASELARAEREARERQAAADRAEVDAVDADRRASEARARAQKARELAAAADAAAAQARKALAEAERP
jgi:hypothetical protein